MDSPAHLDHILQFRPDLQLVAADGTRHPGHLDFSKPAARELLCDLVEEMCPLFDGPVVHLGGDEFFPAPWQGTGPDVVTDAAVPQLGAYAREVTGQEEATALDGYRHHLNELAALVRSHGKRARIFNDDVHPGRGVHPIDPRTEIDEWVRWNDSLPSVLDHLAAGHQVVNGNGDHLYFILTEDGVGQGPYKSPRSIRERRTPRTFPGLAGSAGDIVLPDEVPIIGAHLSVWCDAPDVLTEQEVATQLQPWLEAFAERTAGQH
ncbi:family 20 glycosylhydrolase [Propionibacteriaceae bacterium Y1685]